MNYIEVIAKQIWQITEPEDPLPHQTNWDTWGPLFRIYALLALTTGTATTSENVHDAWSVWHCEIDENHRSLIPFNELSHEIQMMDDYWRDAIIEVAMDLET